MMITQIESGSRSGRAQGKSFPSGFSLAELMVVVSIMLLLSAIALPRLLDAQKKAYEAGVVSFLRVLQTNQESYRLANGSYADNFTDLGLVALAPAAPRDLGVPDELSQRMALFPPIGPSSVYAAQAPQQPPAKTPPPPPTGDQGFGNTNPAKRPGKTGASPGAPALGAGGSGGGGGGGPSKGGRAGGQGIGRPRKGAGSGSSLGGAPLGGGTGAPVPGGSGAPQAGGGSAGSFSPSPASAAKTNVVLKHNYIFTLLRPTPITWTCTVAPVRDRGNSKFFYLDQTGVMRVELGKFAGSTSPQL
jgi:prepilin-type N-terminal cleavage/methylation domain-containing protein